MPAETREEAKRGQDLHKGDSAICELPDLSNAQELAGVRPEQIADHLELLGWTLTVDSRGKKS